MLQIRVTAIQKIHSFLHTDHNSKDEEDEAYEDIVKLLKDEYEPNEAMEFGTKMHSILETGKCDDPEYTFLAYDILKYREKGIAELREYKDYEIFDKVINVTGKADVVQADTIIDYKMTFNKYSIHDRFYFSLQWKFYLDIFDCSNFKYKVFFFGNEKELKQVFIFNMCRYEDMHRDCVRALEEVYTFLKDKDLLHYLEEDEMKL